MAAQASLFDENPERSEYTRQLQALVAPVAANVGAIADDPVCLDVAKAIWAAFGDAETPGGLTRAQLGFACASVCDEATFESRFNVLHGLGMLEPILDKLHQGRYVFNPTSAAGLMVFQRLAERGGVDELMTLLDRTRAELESGTATREQLRLRLRDAQAMLTTSADYLLRLVSSSPLSALIAQRRHHSHASLFADVQELDRQVTARFPDLDQAMFRLVQEAQRYVSVREQFVGRLLDEGAVARDFSLLDPEQYLEAAYTAPVERLAAVFEAIVTDPPDVFLDPGLLARLVSEYTPRLAARHRPPRPADPPPDDDPVQRAQDRAAETRRRRELAAELHLQGGPQVELTSELRRAGWPGAAIKVAEVIAASRDQELGYAVSMTNELIVDPGGPVTHVTPLTFHRAGSGQDPGASTVQSATDEPAPPHEVSRG